MLKKIFSSLLVLFLLFNVSAGFCQENTDLDAILTNLSKKDTQIKDLQANYVQTIKYYSTDEEIQTEGVFKHKKQDFIYLEQTKPSKQITYIDGKKITTYVPANKQAIVEKWKDVLNADMILTSIFKLTKNYKTLKKNYDLQLQNQNTTEYNFLLKPLNKKENWTMRIVINKTNSLISSTSFDNGNFVVNVEIKNYKLNNNFTENTFKFVAPKMVDVIEL